MTKNAGNETSVPEARIPDIDRSVNQQPKNDRCTGAVVKTEGGDGWEAEYEVGKVKPCSRSA